MAQLYILYLYRTSKGMGIQALYHLFRGTEGYSHASHWKVVGLGQERPPEIRCLRLQVDIDDGNQRVDISAHCDVIATIPHQQVLMEVGIKYTVLSNGRIRVENDVHLKPILRRKIMSLPRVGMRFQLDKAYYHTAYFGRGPGEVSSVGSFFNFQKNYSLTPFEFCLLRTIPIASLAHLWASTRQHQVKCTQSTLSRVRMALARTVSG